MTFSLPKESWWPVDLRCLLSGRSGLQFASLLWPFKRLLGCCLVSPMYNIYIYLKNDIGVHIFLLIKLYVLKTSQCGWNPEQNST